MERTLEEHIASATAIFEARVSAVEPLDPNLGGGPLRVRLDVVQRFRGSVEHEHVEVQTAGSSASCGFPFELGRSYLIYADGPSDALRVGLCSATKRMEDADVDRAALGSGTVPVDVEDSPAPPPPAAAPGRGGCAGCTVANGGTFSWSLLMLGLLALVLARRAHNR
jgi:MYXO-CTERM domain-containing protein